MAAQRIHNEWFRLLERQSCHCGAKKTTGRTYSWGQYVSGRWNTVTRVCKDCFKTRCLPRLLEHAKGCGCGFQLVGYQGQKLPPWLKLPEKQEAA
jgi:hypothetical protein